MRPGRKAVRPRDPRGYLGRLGRLAAVKTRQAQQIRNADTTARGERAAAEADLDAAALNWALRQLDPERQFLERFFADLQGDHPHG